MENATVTPTTPKKTAKASRKKLPSHQTHGALAPKPISMMKLFGIRDGYNTDSIDEYKAELDAMTDSDLHEHAHNIGIVPLDSRDKLTRDLERKFIESKMNQRGPRSIRVKTNPELADFMAKRAEVLA